MTVYSGLIQSQQKMLRTSLVSICLFSCLAVALEVLPGSEPTKSLPENLIEKYKFDIININNKNGFALNTSRLEFVDIPNWTFKYGTQKMNVYLDTVQDIVPVVSSTECLTSNIECKGSASPCKVQVTQGKTKAFQTTSSLAVKFGFSFGKEVVGLANIDVTATQSFSHTWTDMSSISTDWSVPVGDNAYLGVSRVVAQGNIKTYKIPVFYEIYGSQGISSWKMNTFDGHGECFTTGSNSPSKDLIMSQQWTEKGYNYRLYVKPNDPGAFYIQLFWWNDATDIVRCQYGEDALYNSGDVVFPLDDAYGEKFTKIGLVDKCDSMNSWNYGGGWIYKKMIG